MTIAMPPAQRFALMPSVGVSMVACHQGWVLTCQTCGWSRKLSQARKNFRGPVAGWIDKLLLSHGPGHELKVIIQ